MSRQLSLFPEITDKISPESSDKKAEVLPSDLPSVDEVLIATGRF